MLRTRKAVTVPGASNWTAYHHTGSRSSSSWPLATMRAGSARPPTERENFAPKYARNAASVAGSSASVRSGRPEWRRSAASRSSWKKRMRTTTTLFSTAAAP